MRTNDGGDTEILLHRPPGHRTFLRIADDADVVPVSTLSIDDMLCIPRGIAAVLKWDLAYVCDEFDAVKGHSNWRDVGLESEDVFVFAERHSITACCFWQDGMLKQQVAHPRQHCKTLAWVIEGGHALFYRSVKGVKGKLRQTRELRLRTDRRELCLPEVGEFEEVRPGHWSHTDLERLRRQMLFEGRTCKITASAPHELRSMRIGKDCVVHAMPPQWRLINEWYQKLGLQYNGAGLPSATERRPSSAAMTGPGPALDAAAAAAFVAST
jgi:hypothetical protein